jgi:hypothetical protein
MSKTANKEKLIDELSDPLTWDASQLILEDVTEQKLPNDPTLKAFNIKIRNRNSNGTKGRLLFKFDRCPSLGISTKYGESLGLKMYDGSPSERQERTITVINDICDKIKQFIVENKKDLKKNKLTGVNDSDFKFLCPIKYKEDEDGNRVSDVAPLMNLKFLTGKDKDGSGIVRTYFTVEDEVDENGDALEADWHDYISQRCFATCLVRFDSIFVGNMITLRCYLEECDLKLLESSGKKRFLRPGGKKISASSTNTKISINEEDEGKSQSDDEDAPKHSYNNTPLFTPKITFSDKEDDEEDDQPPKVEVKPEPKRGVVKKKTSSK